MQLGDWVEFEQIVVKERTAGGSKPATMALGRPRRGMLVGERMVYDVADGSPPTLSNARRVLLVAVSLGRMYRVFPVDVRPTVPPRRRKAAGAPPALSVASGPSPAAGVTIRLPAPPQGGGRVPLSKADLAILVADELNRLACAARFFTAYDVTRALRDANPGYQIAHGEVREAVHELMQPFLASGVYDRETATFGTETAVRYVPV